MCQDLHAMQLPLPLPLPLPPPWPARLTGPNSPCFLCLCLAHDQNGSQPSWLDRVAATAPHPTPVCFLRSLQEPLAPSSSPSELLAACCGPVGGDSDRPRGDTIWAGSSRCRVVRKTRISQSVPGCFPTAGAVSSLIRWPAGAPCVRSRQRLCVDPQKSGHPGTGAQ